VHDSPEPRFRVSRSAHLVADNGDPGPAVVVLSDTQAETQAILVPELGFTCIAFRVSVGDQIWNVLAEPPTIDDLRNRPGRFGVPIMFPWPNRIRAGLFEFGGTQYRMPLAPNGPHAIHGLVRERPWTVEQTAMDQGGSFCRASIAIGDGPDEIWPFPARLTVEYRLFGRTLTLTAQAENIGTVPMPLGFGIHPWFPLPLGPGGARQSTEVQLGAEAFWRLDDTMCATGEIAPVTDGFDARAWCPIEDRFIDDVYTSLPLADGWFTAEARDPASGRSIVVRSDSTFREHVVFAPLHAPVLCLEPYTCATDAFNLDARGVVAGTIVLEPGGQWHGQMMIEARA
jgi:aldose 1-epimerase